MGENPLSFALLGLRLSIYAAYSAESPQNFKGSTLEKHHASHHVHDGAIHPFCFAIDGLVITLTDLM